MHVRILELSLLMVLILHCAAGAVWRKQQYTLTICQQAQLRLYPALLSNGLLGFGIPTVRATVEYRWISRAMIYTDRQYQHCLHISHRIS